MLRLGPDREVLGIYLQRRLLLAGAHAARPRHPCRLWSVEVGDREIVGAGAAGAARHGDDGLAMIRLMVLDVIARSASDEAIRLCLPSPDCFAKPVIGCAFARPVGSR